MQYLQQFPTSFSVEHTKVKFGAFVPFELVTGIKEHEYTGYYKDHRITLWYNDNFWVLKVYHTGKCLAFIRHPDPEASVKDLQRIAQVGCFYIDHICPELEDAIYINGIPVR